MVRLALLHLGAGATLGALLLVAKAGIGSPDAWRALGAHREMLLVGWLVQLAGGVAWWILPRRDGSRGPAAVPAAACALLNGGIACVALAGGLGIPTLAAAGRGAELAGVALLAGALWPRVRTTRG